MKSTVNVFVGLCVASILIVICIYYSSAYNKNPVHLPPIFNSNSNNNTNIRDIKSVVRRSSLATNSSSSASTASTSPTTAATRNTIISNKIAILQMTNEKTVQKVAESIRNKKEYADKHNYTLVEDTPSGVERMAKWYKLKSVLKAFNDKQIEWVWMLDTDTIVTNLNIEISYLTRLAALNNFHVILSFDCANINTGNTNVSVDFIEQAWNTFGKEVGVNDEMCDNNGVIAIYKKKIFNKYILIIPQISINQYPSENVCQTQRAWQTGDFLIHFAGMHSPQLFFKYVDLAAKIKNDLNLFTTQKWLDFIVDWHKKNYNTSLVLNSVK